MNMVDREDVVCGSILESWVSERFRRSLEVMESGSEMVISLEEPPEDAILAVLPDKWPFGVVDVEEIQCHEAVEVGWIGSV
jgi:hypothetical protein